MFFTVKYGDDQSHIFNMNCQNNILLHNIKERCSCHTEDIVELSDDQGVVKNLHKNLYDNGRDYLQERESFILLRVDRQGEYDGDYESYVPLLSGKDSDREFLERLNPKPTATRSHSQGRHGRHQEDDSRTSRATGRRSSLVHAANGRRSSVSKRGNRLLANTGSSSSKK